MTRGGPRKGAGRPAAPDGRTKMLGPVRVNEVEMEEIAAAIQPHETVAEFVREACAALASDRMSERLR